MKIGFLSHYDGNLYQFRLPVMQELVKKGYEVFAIVPRGKVFDEFKKYDIIAISYEIDRGSLNPFKEIKAIYNIYKAIKPLNLDLLHTFTAKPNIYGTIAAKLAGIDNILNLVEGLGSFYTNDNLKSILVRNVMEFFYKQIFNISKGCIFVNSDDPVYMIKKHIISPKKVKIIKSVGVDTNFYSMNKYNEEQLLKIRKTLNLSKNDIVITMIARAIWDKGIKEYYKCAEVLNRKYSNIRFLYVGDIDKGNPNCAQENFLKNKNVNWLGFRKDIRDILAVSNIVALPSYREGVPRTLLEAASMGKAIVTTNAPGCREVVEDGVNGFLVPIKDYKSLAEKIEVLINNKELREKFGKNSRIKAVNEFDIKIVVDKYLEVYEEILKGNQ